MPPADRERLLAAAGAIAPRIRALGYVWVAIDLEGYRSGSMNEALPANGAAPATPAPA